MNTGIKKIISPKSLIAAAVLITNLSNAQTVSNAIVKFDFRFPVDMQTNFWVDKTNEFIIKDQDGKTLSISTIDTIMRYTIKRLEKLVDAEIMPVKIGTLELNMISKLKGLPDEKPKDAAKTGKYNLMFEITATTCQGGESPWDFSPFKSYISPFKRKVKVVMILQINEYDKDAKEIVSYKERTMMKEIKTQITILNVSTEVSLTGNELFGLYVESLENTLANGKK